MNGSHAPELTDLLKEITEDIAKYVIKEGQPIILIDEYSWYTEVLSLMAKQVNLCEAEEGDNTRLKEFFYQPDINQLRSNQNLKKMIRDFGDTLDDRFKNAETITKLNRGSREIRKVLKRENLGESPKSIAELAKQDPILFGMYITLYNEGSKFEHSDISTTKLYRKQAAEGYPTDQVFIFDLGKSNKEGWFKVFQYSQMSLFFAFDSICKRVKERESQLFEATPYGKGAYSEENFNRILLKFNACMSLYEKRENEQ